MDRGARSPATGGLLGRSAGVVGLGALAHYVPSVAVLGTFLATPPRALPFGWCRWRLPRHARGVALTFDDGPSTEHTPRTLELLDELGLRATFFVVGAEAVEHPDVVAELHRRGHQVGVHGFHHHHHLLRSPSWTRRDTLAAVEVVTAATGQPPRWYRPPYGQMTARTILEARRHGMEVVLWSQWGKEFAETTVEAVVGRLADGARPGAVLLLHDSDRYAPAGTAARTHQVLTPLAELLAARRLPTLQLDGQPFASSTPFDRHPAASR